MKCNNVLFTVKAVIYVRVQFYTNTDSQTFLKKEIFIKSLVQLYNCIEFDGMHFCSIIFCAQVKKIQYKKISTFTEFEEV